MMIRTIVPSQPTTITLIKRTFSMKWGSVAEYFTIANLCSEANRIRCLENLQKGPELILAKKPPIRTAAVLIPICIQKDGCISLLYTLRSAKLSRHIRQVSFPGGIRDAADASYVDCALRETFEEIGISRDRINVWGTGKLVTPKSGASIMPVIGMIDNYHSDMLKLNRAEVEKVFLVPIERLCSDIMVRRHTQYRGMYTAPLYLGFGERIWGITGFMTHLFLSALVPKEYYKRRLKHVPNYRF